MMFLHRMHWTASALGVVIAVVFLYWLAETHWLTPPVSTAASAAPANRAPEAAVSAVVPNSTQRDSAQPRAEVGPLGDASVYVEYDDEQPAVAIQVALEPMATGGTRAGTRETDATGRTRFSGLRPGEYRLHVDRSLVDFARARVIITAGVCVEVRLRIEVLLTAQIQVVDEHATPVAGAEVWLGYPVIAGRDAERIGKTDAEGKYVLRVGANPVVVGARAKQHLPSKLHYLHTVSHGAVDIVLRLPGSGGDVIGEVMGNHGEPIANATVRIGTGSLDLIAIGETGPPLPGQAFTDSEGGFAVSGLPPGDAPVFVHATGFAPWIGTCTVTTTSTARMRIELQTGTTVQGRVVDEHERACAKAIVSCGEPRTLFFNSVATDADGHYSLFGLAAGKQEIQAMHPQHGRGAAMVDCVVGEVAEADISLSVGVVVAGRVVCDDDDAPMSRAWVLVTQVGHPNRGIYTDDNGAFRITSLQPGPADITAQHPALRRQTQALQLPTSNEVLLRLEKLGDLTARAVGRVVAADGSPVANALLHVPLPGGSNADYRTDPAGVFDTPMYPGRNRMVVEASGWPKVFLPWRELEPFETWNVGDVQLVTGGRFRLATIDGQWPSSMHVAMFDQDKEWCGSVMPDSEGHTSPPLHPGSYDLYVWGKGIARQVLTAAVTSGAITDVTFAPRRGAKVEVELLGPGSADGQETVHIRITSPSGRFADESKPWPSGKPYRKDFYLAPGVYDFRVDWRKLVREQRVSIESEDSGAQVRMDFR